jgi:hypothetical protein
LRFPYNRACRQGFSYSFGIATGALSVAAAGMSQNKCFPTVQCQLLKLRLVTRALGLPLFKGELERRLKQAEAACEWAQVLRGLEGLQEVELTYQDRRFLLRSQLNGETTAALRAAGTAAPPTLREVAASAA